MQYFCGSPILFHYKMYAREMVFSLFFSFVEICPFCFKMLSKKKKIKLLLSIFQRIVSRQKPINPSHFDRQMEIKCQSWIVICISLLSIFEFLSILCFFFHFINPNEGIFLLKWHFHCCLPSYLCDNDNTVQFSLCVCDFFLSLFSRIESQFFEYSLSAGVLYSVCMCVFFVSFQFVNCDKMENLKFYFLFILFPTSFK